MNGAYYDSTRATRSLLLRLPDAVVHGNGAVFNADVHVRGGKWYFELPGGVARPVLRRFRRLLSLVMVWSDSFQHFVFDTLPKLNFVAGFLLQHGSDVHILGMGGVGFNTILPVRVPAHHTRAHAGAHTDVRMYTHPRTHTPSAAAACVSLR
jgi:hypothetical protein